MTPTSLAIRTLRGLALAACCAGLLNACGGSTSQVSRFMPERVLAFGDELNFLTSDGHKYSVNALKTDKTLDCDASPVWVQYMVLKLYGTVFGECSGAGNIGAFNLAVVGSRVDDFTTQINGYVSGSGFQSSDLVTVLVGMHDVMDLYRLYDGSNKATLVAAAQSKGEQLGDALVKVTGPHAGAVRIEGKPRAAWRVAVIETQNRKPQGKVYQCLSYRRAVSAGLVCLCAAMPVHAGCGTA